MTISAVILTKNEEGNINRCLQSLYWCDEIIIIDDYSTDETINRIKNYELRIKNKKTKIYKRHLNNDFASQRNFGLSKATGDWVLFIDADELVSPDLAGEIQKEIKRGLFSSFKIKRQDLFLSKWLKYGETGSAVFVRLAKKDTGVWQGRVHEVWHANTPAAELSNPLHHLPHKNLSSFISKINYYTDIVAQYWIEQGRQVKYWEIVVYPIGKFFQNYFLRKGILDGIQGLIMAVMMTFHSFLARAKAKTALK